MEEVTGDVVVAFDVDTTGRADMGSVEVLYETHWLFAQAVLGNLPQIRFRPAVNNCRKMPWSVEQRVRFSLQ